MEFAHQCFLRGHENLLESIKRKASSKSVNLLQPLLHLLHPTFHSNLIWLFQGGGAGHGGQQLGVAGGANFVPASLGNKVNDVLSEVQDIKSKQEDMDGKWETMKKENEALWREVVGLRWVLAYLNH